MEIFKKIKVLILKIKGKRDNKNQLLLNRPYKKYSVTVLFPTDEMRERALSKL